MDTVSEANVSEGLAQGLYVVATVGVEHMTLRTKGVDSTNEPPCPTIQSNALHVKGATE